MESLLSLDELLSGTKGLLVCKREFCCFTNVTTDSRNVTENSLFVPLVGEVQNGHKYVPQAVEKGASVILINKTEYEKDRKVYDQLCKENDSLVIICVENTLHGLQDAAETYVSKFPELIKISVTGSSGKTTTKEMLVSVFKEKYGDKLVYTKGNFNSETGLPLSVFNIRSNHQIGIFEMGMNRENEIGEISKVLKSKYGLITNIGTAHIGILGSRENIAKEKRKSFNYIPSDGAVFVPENDDFADYCCENVKGKTVKFGKNVPESISGVKFVADKGLFGSEFILDGLTVNLPLSGDYNFQNALGVIACAKELGLSSQIIKQGLENVVALSGRMEIKKSKLTNGKKVILIKDCYNANLDSMCSVLDFCTNLKDYGNKIYVLGDMKELGQESENSHRKVGKKIASSDAAYVFLAGEEMKAAYEEIGKETNHFIFEKSSENYKKIAQTILKVSSDNDIILFKGSHSMELETIIPMIECNKDGE